MKRHKCLEWTLFVCAALGGLPKVLMKEGISRTLAKREKMNQFRYQAQKFSNSDADPQFSKNWLMFWPKIYRPGQPNWE